MKTDDVLSLLVRAGATPISGEAMSGCLGVSRAAVWQAVEALRREGYMISSAPRRGYLLESSPDRLSPGALAGATAGRLVGREIVCLDTVDSTNDEVKRRAAAGAAEGLVVLADSQTKGKGRRGRAFSSPAGAGLYLSILLRPSCKLEEMFQLTAWTAVAVCRAVEACTGLSPKIKWTNDIILDGKKLCGILTELGIVGEIGAPDYVATGIGINVTQRLEDFPPEVRSVAISLAQMLPQPPRRLSLAAALIDALDGMYAEFPFRQTHYLAEYRARCVTLGRQVRLLAPGKEAEEVFALDIDDSFALRVRHADGREETIRAGEVSVRGLCGYVE